MRNKLFIRMLALVLVPMLAMAAWAQPARASSNIPTLSATLGRYGFDLSWNSIDAALSYIVRVHYYSSADGVRDWYEDYLVNAPSTTMHYEPSVTGWYNFTIRSVLGLSNSGWSGFTPRTFFTVPAPTPDPSTPEPLPSFGPLPSFSPVPLPTSIPPTLFFSNMSYNYYTYSSAYNHYYNRNGTNTVTPPPFINFPFVSSSVSVPVHFDINNSLMPLTGDDSDYANIAVRVSLSSYNIGDLLNFSFVFDDLLAKFAVVSSDPGEHIANPFVSLTVWDVSSRDRVFWSPSSLLTFDQLIYGYSSSLVLDVEGLSDLEFELNIIPQLSPDLILPMYLDGDSVTFSIWGSSSMVDDPSAPIVDSVNNQTSIIGSFFSWLWDGLRFGFYWLGDLLGISFADLNFAIRASAEALGNTISRGFTDTLLLIDYSTRNLIDTIDTGFSQLGSDLKDMFIPNVRDLDSLMARIRDSVEPEDGSLLAFPHEVEMELLTIFADDYSSEPPPIELQEFSMQLQGQSYVVFPRLNISLSTIFPSEFLTYVRTFGDITLGMWVLYLITNKVRKLLNLWYSED